MRVSATGSQRRPRTVRRHYPTPAELGVVRLPVHDPHEDHRNPEPAVVPHDPFSLRREVLGGYRCKSSSWYRNTSSQARRRASRSFFVIGGIAWRAPQYRLSSSSSLSAGTSSLMGREATSVVTQMVGGLPRTRAGIGPALVDALEELPASRPRRRE
jgi:hypothetical protein